MPWLATPLSVSVWRDAALLQFSAVEAARSESRIVLKLVGPAGIELEALSGRHRGPRQAPQLRLLGGSEPAAEIPSAARDLCIKKLFLSW